MEMETFYGVTLSEKEKIAQFDVAESEFENNQKLIIKQIVLGYEAANGEFNVVQAETKSEDKDIKIPIAVLCAGETRTLTPNLEFPHSSVTFKLIQGSGPVHIHGQHIISETDIEEEVYYEEEEEDEIQTNGKNGQKRKNK